MIKKKTIQKEVEAIDDVICNKCGKSTRDEIDLNLEYVELHARWGYGSKKDLEEHKSHICEKCYDELLASFVIPPEISLYM